MDDEWASDERVRNHGDDVMDEDAEDGEVDHGQPPAAVAVDFPWRQSSYLTPAKGMDAVLPRRRSKLPERAVQLRLPMQNQT